MLVMHTRYRVTPREKKKRTHRTVRKKKKGRLVCPDGQKKKRQQQQLDAFHLTNERERSPAEFVLLSGCLPFPCATSCGG